MVDQIIRPADLPNRSNPVSSEKIPVDNGVSVGGATIQSIVESGRPAASRPEAEAGVNSVKAMTPLTTDQKIEYEIGRSIASKAQGDKADSAIQEIVAGANTTVDSADPQRPIISSSGNPSVGFKSDIVVVDGQTDWRVARNYKTVSDLLADDGSGDMGMGYAGSGANVIVDAGQIITAQGFRYEVAASDEADAHVETAGGVKLNVAPATVYDPRQFGILAESEDVVYTTQQWQKLLDFAGGAWIDGGGRWYEIDRIFGHSHQRIRNVKFLKAPSSVDSNAPLTFESARWISGPTPPDPITDIVLEDIEIDGNRDLQTNILAASEDGGRHCIAIYGRVHNLTLRRVYAHHAATDGVCIWSGHRRNPVYADRLDSDFCFRNIVLEDCRLEWNGRCGYSIDAVDGLTSINGKYNDNGRDTKDTDPWDLSGGNQSSYGSRARTFPANGHRFGRGFFWEEYGLGSSFANMVSIGDQLHRNSQGLLIHSNLLYADRLSPGYLPRGPFKILEVDVDTPLNVTEHGMSLQNFPSLAVYSAIAGGEILAFEDLRISGRLQGQILLRGVKNFHFDGDIKLPTPLSAKILTRAVQGVTAKTGGIERGFIGAIDNDYWYRPVVSGGGNTENITGATPRELDISGPYILKYTSTAQAIGGGIVSLIFTPPSGHAIEILSANTVLNATNTPIGCSIGESNVVVPSVLAGQVIRFTITVAVRRDD